MEKLPNIIFKELEKARNEKYAEARELRRRGLNAIANKREDEGFAAQYKLIDLVGQRPPLNFDESE